MSSYFELNGIPCLDPQGVLQHCQDKGIDVSSWYGKANSFHHQRGVDPSYGYLLVQNSVVEGIQAQYLNEGFINGSGLVIRVVEDVQGVETASLFQFKEVHVEDARKISPAATVSQGFSYVKVTDPRYKLSEHKVGRALNQVRHLNTKKDRSWYFPDTIKAERDPASSEDDPKQLPYGWDDLFKMLFAPVGLPLDTTVVTFPSWIPQNLRWHTTTHRDALEMLLQWLNLTIVYHPITINKYGQPDRDSGLFALVSIEDPQNQLSDLTNKLDPNYLVFDTQNMMETYGASAPAAYNFFTPLSEPALPYTISNLQEINTTIPFVPRTARSSGISPNDGTTRDVLLPYVFFPRPVDQGAAIPPWADRYTDFIIRMRKFYSLFPGKDATYAKLHKIKLSSFIQSLSWYDLGAGPRTRLISIEDRKWLIVPEKMEPFKYEIAIADETIGLGQKAFSLKTDPPVDGSTVTNTSNWKIDDPERDKANFGYGRVTIKNEKLDSSAEARVENFCNQFLFKGHAVLVLDRRYAVSTESPSLLYGIPKNNLLPTSIDSNFFKYRAASGFKDDPNQDDGSFRDLDIPSDCILEESGRTFYQKVAKTIKEAAEAKQLPVVLPVAIFAPGRTSDRNELRLISILTEPTASNAKPLIYFELVSDLPLQATSARARPVKADNTLDNQAPEFAVLDERQRFVGKVAYTDGVSGSNVPGYRGWAEFFSDDIGDGIPGWRIVDMEGPADFILVRLAENYPNNPSNGIRVKINESAARTGHSDSERLPRRNSESYDFLAYDLNSTAKGAKSNDKWWVIYRADLDRYVFYKRAVDSESTATNRVGVITSPVNKAIVASTGITPGTGSSVTLMELVDGKYFPSGEATLVPHSLSKTTIEASSINPQAVIGSIQTQPDGAKFFLVSNVFDLSALPGFDVGKTQIAYHKKDDLEFTLDAKKCAGGTP